MEQKISTRNQQRDLAFKTVFVMNERQERDPNKIVDYINSEFFWFDSDISFAKSILAAVANHHDESVRMISEFAMSMGTTKTSPIDIAILEILITEIYFLKPPTPVPVAINEALILWNNYWKEWSTSFINWVIAQILKKYEAPWE